MSQLSEPKHYINKTVERLIVPELPQESLEPWMEKYETVRRCMDEGTDIPLKLKKWLSYERRNLEGQYEKKRTREQIELLAEIDIVPLDQPPIRLQWQRRYEEYTKFYQKKQRAPSRVHERSLYNWRRKQIQKLENHALDEEQIELLKDVGIVSEGDAKSVDL